MQKKVKDLESYIQAYIDKHPNCKVTVSVEKMVVNDTSLKQNGTKWSVVVSHEPIELLC